MSRRALLRLFSVYLSISSCRQVVGIEDAQVDPTLSQQSSGTSGSMSSLQGASAGGGGGEGALAALGSQPNEVLAGAASQGGDRPDAGAAGAAGTPETPSVCEQYCSAVTSNCTGAFAVYTSQASCLSVCAALPEGKPGDTEVNSVQCRLHAALIAKDEVPHYCPVAGPGGNGECGSNCESLCALREQICAPYADSDENGCLQSCSELQDLGTYSTDLSVGQYSGPHVQCRLYHVSAAATNDAKRHCLHVDGAAPCR